MITASWLAFAIIRRLLSGNHVSQTLEEQWQIVILSMEINLAIHDGHYAVTPAISAKDCLAINDLWISDLTLEYHSDEKLVSQLFPIGAWKPSR